MKICDSIRLISITIGVACASCTTSIEASELPQDSAEARALSFLQEEVPAWFRENDCFSCHNNGDAARSLYVAAKRGIEVPVDALVQTTEWLKQPGKWDDNKGDPGYSDKQLADIQFAAALLAAHSAGLASDGSSLIAAAEKLKATQQPDGAWHIGPPHTLGSPATYGTHLATSIAIRVLKAADKSKFGNPIARAEEYLRRSPIRSVPEAAAVVMTFQPIAQSGRTPKVSAALEFMKRAQTSDGGWGPYPGSPPEAFDTALVLLALAPLAGEPAANAMIVKGRTYLEATQNPDGSWPETTRPSGGDSYAQRISTTGWVLLALLETPPAFRLPR